MLIGKEPWHPPTAHSMTDCPESLSGNAIGFAEFHLDDNFDLFGMTLQQRMSPAPIQVAIWHTRGRNIRPRHGAARCWCGWPDRLVEPWACPKVQPAGCTVRRRPSLAAIVPGRSAAACLVSAVTALSSRDGA